MTDDYYIHPYVYYSLDPGPKTIGPNTYFTFFTQEGRVKVRVVGTHKLPKRRWYRKFAKVPVEVIE
jgi:hypothetical protein